MTIGGVCLGLGMMLTATLVRPETLVTLDTAHLLGILVLLTCPALTRMAIGLDRAVLRARAATADQQRACGPAPDEISIPAQVPTQNQTQTQAPAPTPAPTLAPTLAQARVAPHSPHSRGARGAHHARTQGRDDAPGVYDLAS